MAKGGTNLCSICTHPQADHINADLLAAPVSHVAASYGLTYQTLHRHIGKCLETNSDGLREHLRIRSFSAIEGRLEFILSETEEAYFAAKEVLMVNGRINFHPRAHEVNVVYTTIDDKGKETQHVAPLDELLARVEHRTGYRTTHSYIKTEDMRKSFRDAILLMDTVIGRITKLFGHDRQLERPLQKELDAIYSACKLSAKRLGTTVEEELLAFLDVMGHRLRPEVRGMLQKGVSEAGALPAPAGKVKDRPVSSAQELEIRAQDKEIRAVEPEIGEVDVGLLE